MTVLYNNLPLHSEEDYTYNVSLEGNAYNLRFYYNNRMEKWIFDLSYANGDPIILGTPLVPNYELLIYYITPLSGMFYLEPIGKNQNETIINPFELWKYYNFFYIYDDEE